MILDSFGTHLDSSGRTVGESLEKDNFKKAGDILAEIWSAVCIDGHEVVARYIDPNNEWRRNFILDYVRPHAGLCHMIT